MSSILATGGGGFIGSHITARRVERVLGREPKVLLEDALPRTVDAFVNDHGIAAASV